MGLQIEKTIKVGGKVDKYKKAVNLKGFLMELHDFFTKNGFKDILGEKVGEDKSTKKDFLGGWAKAGEFVDNKAKDRNDNNIPNNRTGDMFERRYVLIKKGSKYEFETQWECFKTAPYSPCGWYQFMILIEVRDVQDVEIIENGKTKKMQKGSWEVSTEMLYKNSFFEDYIQKIPIIKNYPNIHELIFKQIHGKIVKADIEEFGQKKLIPAIHKTIDKHFKT